VPGDVVPAVRDRPDLDLDGLSDQGVVRTRWRCVSTRGHGFLRGMRGPRRRLLV
jgi:hypothetical protein